MSSNVQYLQMDLIFGLNFFSKKIYYFMNFQKKDRNEPYLKITGPVIGELYLDR